jgi:signal transduction histidine kinase
MLRQILDNLISNAIKYSPAETEISVIGLTQDDAAVISVIDRGRGIPEGDRAKLFEPYYRASNSRGVHGTGIGLYVVQRYIASHGGAIDIDSKLGAGTTVTIRIPIGQNPQDDSSAAAPDSVH